MKVFNKIFITLSVMLYIITSVSAQNISQESLIKRRAVEKVAQMNDYISFMASKDKSIEIRKYYSTKALKLFIGKGYSYEENGVNKDGVLMEVTSINKKTKNNRYVRNYFSNLMKLCYSDIKIESTEIANIKVSNLQKVDDNLYVCTCEYDQAFVGYRDGIPVYKDITTKRIKCYITVEETEEGTEFIIMLGDITALETKPHN